MAELNQIYKCGACQNMTEVVRPGVGELVCCGKPMELLKSKTKDEGMEKHVPVIEKTDQGIKIKIGSVPHPMEESHRIEWIELIADSKSYRKHLKPGDKAEAEFCIQADEMTAREHCNIHGLWADK